MEHKEINGNSKHGQRKVKLKQQVIWIMLCCMYAVVILKTYGRDISNQI